MTAMFATIKTFFIAALQYIATLGVVQLLLSAVAFLATWLVMTFGLSAAVSTGIAWAMFAIGAMLIGYVLYKGTKALVGWIAGFFMGKSVKDMSEAELAAQATKFHDDAAQQAAAQAEATAQEGAAAAAQAQAAAQPA